MSSKEGRGVGVCCERGSNKVRVLQYFKVRNEIRVPKVVSNGLMVDTTPCTFSDRVSRGRSLGGTDL